MSDKPETKTDRIVRAFLDHPVYAWLVVVALALAGAGQAAGGFTSIAAMFKRGGPVSVSSPPTTPQRPASPHDVTAPAAELGRDAVADEGTPVANVRVTDVVVEAVHEAHPKKYELRGTAHFSNVGEVPITAGCAEASAILRFLVPGPNGPQITATSWRLLGQYSLPSCTVQLGVGETQTFPISIIFDRPTEDFVDVNLMVQFHKDALAEGAQGRDNRRVWIASQRTRFE